MNNNMTELTINELMLLSMKRKKKTQKQVAEKMGISENGVSQLLNRSVNPMNSSLKDFFNAIDYPFIVMWKGFEFNIPDNMSTLWKLQQKAPGFVFRFEDGNEYKVSEIKVKPQKPFIIL